MNYKKHIQRLVVYNVVLIMVLFAVSCNKNYYVVNTSLDNFYNDESIGSDDYQLFSIIKPYKINIEKDMNRVIGISGSEMVKDKPESQLTNFLADLLIIEGNKFLKKTGRDFKAEVSYFNYGGIRSGLFKGDITVGKIYELMPFENEMVFLKLKGEDLKVFLDKIADGGGDSVGGVKFMINNGKAENIEIMGNPINMNSEYWLATNNYIADGGDGMEMLKNRIELIESGELIREIIIKHIEDCTEKGKVINPELDGRIYYE